MLLLSQNLVDFGVDPALLQLGLRVEAGHHFAHVEDENVLRAQDTNYN